MQNKPIFTGVQQAARGKLSAQPEVGHRHVFGLDWTRGDSPTTVVVIDASTGQMVDIERFHFGGWGEHRKRIQYMYTLWNPFLIIADKNAIGAPNVEALQAEGLPVHGVALTTKLVGHMAAALAIAIEDGRLALSPYPPLLNQLAEARFAEPEASQIPHHYPRIVMPEGMEIDLLTATAMAWWGIKYYNPSGVISFV